MKASKWPLFIFILWVSITLVNGPALAGNTSKLSNVFALDTRSDIFPPVNGWQILTNRSATFNEDVLVDNHGKVWCFYFRSSGEQQPIYLKIYHHTGYIYKSEQVVGYSSKRPQPEYNSIRAALNDSTGDVWVALQGISGGYFVIYDSTGKVKQDSTLFAGNCFAPKLVQDKNGNMWASWHTYYNGGSESVARIARYDRNGENTLKPTDISRQNFVINTDIAIDDSNHIWYVFETKQNDSYTARYSVLRSNLSFMVNEKIFSQRAMPVNVQRQIYADDVNQRVWILEKDTLASQQQLRVFALNGEALNSIEIGGECSFLCNEKNFLEVIWFDVSNPQNKKYRLNLYDPRDGRYYSTELLADSTYQFIRNGVAYNPHYPTLKVYAIHQAQKLTQLYFQSVTPGFPEIAVKAIQFDTTKISQTYRKQRVARVQNFGNALLRVHNIVPNDNHFKVSETSFQVSPGGAHDIVVEFIPTNEDSLVKHLLFLSNDPKNDSLKVTVSGKGYYPTTPKITVDSDSLIFDSIFLGNAQTKHVYIFNNDRYEPLRVFRITSTNAQFTTADSLGFTLNAKKGKFVPVIFRPTQTGTITGTLNVSSNDPEHENLKVRLRGTGLQTGVSKIAVHPDSLDFGSVAIGHQKSLYLEIENRGEAYLQINSITPADTQFTANPNSFAIPPYSKYYVLITYHARRLGQVLSEIVINSSDPKVANYRVPVRATGRNSIPATMAVTPQQLNFGQIAVGTAKTMYFWISNSGEEALYIRSLTSSNQRFRLNQNSFTVYPGTSQSVSVTFIPDKADTTSGKITVISNDTVHDTVAVAVFGSGRNLTAANMVVSTEQLTFGAVATNQSRTMSFSIYNDGEQTLEVSKISLSQGTVAYSVNPTAVSVPSRQYRWIYVTFTPNVIGEIRSQIYFTSNDPVTPTLSLTGSGRYPLPQQIYVNATNMDFETVAIGRTASQYLWLRNTGETVLTIQNIAHRDSSFSTNISSFALNPGQSQYVLVTFAPKAVRAYRDTLVITSDDPRNTYKYVILTGSGRTLWDQNIQLSSNSLNFGEIAIGRQANYGLMISNTGEKDLVISNITNQKSVFSVSERNLQIPPQSNRTISVNFAPSALTSYQDTLRIHNNDPDSPVVLVLLSGVGRNLQPQKLAVVPDSLFFGQVGIGLTTTQNIQIRNDGEMDLKIDSIKVGGQAFSIRGGGSFTLSPGFSNWVAVDFHPEQVDTFHTRCYIFSNDPNYPRFAVPLLGYSRQLLAPQITFYPGRVNFGDVPLGQRRTNYLYIGNSGEKDLQVSNLLVNNNQFTAEPTVFTVKRGASQAVTLTFQPMSVDTFDAVLTVSSNDPDSSVAFVPISGSGRNWREPQLAYYPEELNYGKVQLGDSSVKELTLQNLGDLDLRISHISITDKRFKASRDTVTIGGNQSAVLRITFWPSDTAEVRGSAIIYSNDPKNYQIQIPLRGSGRALQQRIAVSPAGLDFKEVRINTSTTAYFWVSNFGDKLLTVNKIVTSNAHFKPQITSFSLEPSSSRQVGVNFSPDSVKTFSGWLTIISDDPIADSLLLPVTGKGRALYDQKIVVSVDSLYYGQVAVNNSRTLNLTIGNTGEKNLSISNVRTTNSVYKVNKTAFQVSPGTGETLQITFTPQAEATYKDSLLIINNDPKNGTVIVKLTGIGRKSLPQQIALSDTVLNFGSVLTGASKSLSLVVHNLGEQNLEVFEVAINDTQFAAKERWFVVNPTQSHYLTVIFAPGRSGNFTAQLTLKSNDPTRPEKKVRLQGTGVIYNGARIAARPGTIHFGTTLIGVTKRQPLWIINSSKDSTLKITNFAVNSPHFYVANNQVSVRPKDSVAVQVVYRPQNTGYHNATVTISSNDKYQAQTNLYLDGYGITENVGQQQFASYGWKENGYAPFGKIFSPNPHTDDVLSDGPDRAWFLKDIYLSQYPASAKINICFDDQINLYINGTLVLNQNSTKHERWNILNFDVKSYLKLGRNRIAIMVWNRVDLYGAFDCELIIDGVNRIKRGDQNWLDPDATWWYFGENGKEYPTPAADSLDNRFWFNGEYGLAGLDSVMAKWNFEPSGKDTIYDGSPYGQRAILHNITWVRGVIGQAMQFSGQSNSYAQLFTSLNNVPKTIELWLNCYAARSYTQTILTNRGTGQYGMGLFVSPTMQLGIYYYDGEFVTKFVLNPNTWYFVSTQYKHDKILVYVNNVLVDSTSYVQGNPTGLSSCYLGGNPLETVVSNSFYGAIDELEIKNTITVPTPMAQVATLAHVPLVSASKGQATTLTFDVFPSPFKIISGSFQYALGGSDIYRTKNLAKPDSFISSPLKVTFPGDSVSIRGLKYRLTLVTNYGPVQYPTTGLDYGWLEVKTPHENATITTAPKVHRMISVPYTLDSTAVADVLGDDLGAKDPNKWRLFEWQQSDTAYLAYDSTAWQPTHGFTRGKAYWLITKEPKSFDAGTGYSPENNNFLINLTPGWNMIGDPFPYPVKWSDVQKTSALISAPIYRVTADSVYWMYNVATLLPWEGYFVWNGDMVQRSIIIPPKAVTATSLQKAYQLAEDYLAQHPDIAWLMSADLRCGKYIDNQNLFGTAEYALDGYDPYDLLEVPPIGEYVSLWIDHRQREQDQGAYTVDIRRTGADGYCWDVMVDYSLNSPADNLWLRFAPVTRLPENWMAYLLDLSNDRAINLLDQATISLKPVARTPVHHEYKLVIGSEEFVQQNADDIPLTPLAFELFQNYPNPFNGITTIAFNLPERMAVTIKIYNMLGQLVKTVVDEELRGGHHKLLWDGRSNQGVPVATGLYIIRLETKNHVAAKKLLLIK
ncbi:MAG: choice-of-anchor D domain-containing protein [candidate division KSB1 bacterium]|nr:choice-of-anchor D domain-containing protein [candidate division KSB1 bacterium]MDZ7318022.1 choice-of-anchor D domain-containing protein [candidate division KSB1 bacterium]